MIRSRQKEVRRQSILDAAEALIRDTGTTSFSMLVLAERAGFSPATPYNIFGTKDSILYALLNRSIDSISMRFAQVPGNIGPFEIVLSAADGAARFFISDPAYYRPLFQHLVGVRDALHRPAFMERSFQYWQGALARLRTDGILADDRTRDVLARSMMIYFLGSLDLWTQDELRDDAFRTQIMHGVASLLSAIATPAARPLIRAIVEEAVMSAQWPVVFRQIEDD